MSFGRERKPSKCMYRVRCFCRLSVIKIVFTSFAVNGHRLVACLFPRCFSRNNSSGYGSKLSGEGSKGLVGFNHLVLGVKHVEIEPLEL